jgi:hypothetical protein
MKKLLVVLVNYAEVNTQKLKNHDLYRNTHNALGGR